MECQELHRDELAEKYLNGQFDPATRDKFEIHILQCACCLRSVEAIQILRQELSESAHRLRGYPKSNKP